MKQINCGKCGRNIEKEISIKGYDNIKATQKKLYKGKDVCNTCLTNAIENQKQ